jgi:hypothetical protein
MAKPKVGNRYRFTREHGNPPDQIRVGTEAELVEIVDPDTAGAGDDTNDAYVLSFDQPTLTYDADGNPGVGSVERRWAAEDHHFAADGDQPALLEEVK